MTTTDRESIINNIKKSLEDRYGQFEYLESDSLEGRLQRIFNENSREHDNVVSNARHYRVRIRRNLDGRVIPINLQTEIGRSISDLFHETLSGLEAYMVGKKIKVKINKKRTDEIIPSNDGGIEHFLGLPTREDKNRGSWFNNLIRQCARERWLNGSTVRLLSDSASSCTSRLTSFYNDLKAASGTDEFHEIAARVSTYIDSYFDNMNESTEGAKSVTSLIEKINLLIINEDQTERLVEEDMLDMITSEYFFKALLEICMSNDKEYESVDDIIRVLENSSEVFENGVPDSIKNILNHYSIDKLNEMIWNSDDLDVTLDIDESERESVLRECYLRGKFKDDLNRVISVYDSHLFLQMNSMNNDELCNRLFSICSFYSSCFPFEIRKEDLQNSTYFSYDEIERPQQSQEEIFRKLPLCVIAEHLAEKKLQLCEAVDFRNLDDLELFDILLKKDRFFEYSARQSYIFNFAKMANKLIASRKVINSIIRGGELHMYDLNEKGVRYKLLELGQGIQLEDVSGRIENKNQSRKWNISSLRAGNAEGSNMRKSGERTISLKEIETDTSYSHGRRR